MRDARLLFDFLVQSYGGFAGGFVLWPVALLTFL
jgi:hypothetical protein